MARTNLDEKNLAGTVVLQPGTFYLCNCGLSKEKPFCDGSHITAHIQPEALTIETDTEISFARRPEDRVPPYLKK